MKRRAFIASAAALVAAPALGMPGEEMLDVAGITKMLKQIGPHVLYRTYDPYAQYAGTTFHLFLIHENERSIRGKSAQIAFPSQEGQPLLVSRLELEALLPEGKQRYAGSGDYDKSVKGNGWYGGYGQVSA